MASAAVLLSMWLWPAVDLLPLAHRHDDLPASHPHLAAPTGGMPKGSEHSHAFVIDDEHPRWPK